jgi:hypothetical protein
MADPERLDRLTPRERDVYEVWTKHPDWSNAQTGREVLLPAHVVRRYKQNIREKVGAMVEDPLERLSPKMLAVHELDLQGLSPKEIGRRLLRASSPCGRSWRSSRSASTRPPRPRTSTSKVARTW